jgi:hypothetical protein
MAEVQEIKQPEAKLGAYLIPLAIMWASLAIGTGYNTWKAHEAFYKAEQVNDKVNVLDTQWDKTERRVNRRIDAQNKRLKAIESPDRAK